ncbi:Serine/threonine-protein kinase, partial [Dispira parvispora]
MGQPHSTVLASVANGFSAIGTDGQLHELDNDVFYQKSLGNGQFMKTIRCRHPREGPIVVKLFVKPGTNVSLHSEVALVKSYHRVLKQLSSVLSYPITVETPSAVYLVRQYLYSNLYDRISTRPFLSHLEKTWITFQLLCSVRDIHRLNVCHGDIKCENVLISSWNWSYLCDFAPYKPTFLPEDNPADFSYFFDTSARRTCYVAPERFVPSPTGEGMSGDASVIDPSYLDGYPTAFTTLSRQGPLVPTMDIFSLGCVIAELFLEGKPIFTLSQLLQYKSGEYDPTPELAKIGDEQVQSLIQSMIHPEPTQRLTAEECLQRWQGALFPPIFASFLYPYMTGFATFLASLNPPHKHAGNSQEISGLPTGIAEHPSVSLTSQDESDPAHQLAALYFSYSGAAHQETSEPTNAPPTLPTTILCCSDARIDRVYHDWNVICHNMGLHDATNPPSSFTENQPKRNGRPQVEGSVILVNLITSCLRNAAYPTSKRHGLELLYWLAYNISDELILNRVVPHVLSILTDYSALVRQTAVYVLTQVLSMVTTLTPVNAHIFDEYLLPHIRLLVRDPQPMVRIALASSVASLAQSAQRFVTYKTYHQHMSRQEPPSSSTQKNGVPVLLSLETTALPSDQGPPSQTLDARLWELRKQFQHIITQLLTDSDPNVKRALLADMTPLAVFFGRTLANDFLLSHVITFLNDRDWLLRGAFFEAIVGLATVVGPQSLELYILPLMIQALTDSHEWVVEKVLRAFTSLTRVGLFTKTTLWDLLNLVLPLLYHPSLWIRYGAVVAVVAITNQLPDVDKWCLVLPALQPFLKMDILDITPDTLQQALKPPITRRLLQEVLTKPADKVDQSPKLAPKRLSLGSGGGSEGEFNRRLSLSPHSSPRLLPWPLHHANDSQDSVDLTGATQFRRGDSFTSEPGDITLTGDEDMRIPVQWTHLRHAEPQDIPKLEALSFYINRVRDTYRQSTALEQGRQLGTMANGSSQGPVGRSTQRLASSEGVTLPADSQAERMNSVELRDLGLTPHTEFLTPWDAVRPLYSAAWFAAGPGLDQPKTKFSMLPILRSESNPEHRRDYTDRQWEEPINNTGVTDNTSTGSAAVASPALTPSQWLSSPLVSA